jgi:hypothetical protein
LVATEGYFDGAVVGAGRADYQAEIAGVDNRESEFGGILFCVEARAE